MDAVQFARKLKGLEACASAVEWARDKQCDIIRQHIAASDLFPEE